MAVWASAPTLTVTAVTAQPSTTAVRDRPPTLAIKGPPDHTRPPTTMSHPSRLRLKSCLGQSQPFQPWMLSGEKIVNIFFYILPTYTYINSIKRNSVYSRLLWNHILPVTHQVFSHFNQPVPCRGLRGFWSCIGSYILKKTMTWKNWWSQGILVKSL